MYTTFRMYNKLMSNILTHHNFIIIVVYQANYNLLQSFTLQLDNNIMLFWNKVSAYTIEFNQSLPQLALWKGGVLTTVNRQKRGLAYMYHFA